MLEPTTQEKDVYYKYWCEGKLNDEIRQLIGFSSNKYDQSLPYFIHWCRLKVKEDTVNALMTNTPPMHIVLSEGRRKEFLALVSSGISYPQAAKIMNIPLPTIMDVWFANDPVFKDQVDTIGDLMNAKVQQALYKKANGRTYTKRSVTRTTGTGEKGQPIDTTSVTKTEVMVEGDFNAQKMWLINRDGDRWSADGVTSKEGYKGKILKALENMIGTDNEDEDNEFKAAQAISDPLPQIQGN